MIKIINYSKVFSYCMFHDGKANNYFKMENKHNQNNLENIESEFFNEII